MDVELGIVLELGPDDPRPDGLAELAQRAETAGLDLVVIASGAAPRDAAGGSLDPWTTAVWVAGSTERIAIGMADDRAAASGAPSSAMVEKARQTLAVLAGERLLPAEDRWVTAPAGAGADELRALAGEELPVVVPVRTPEDVDRLAALLADRPAHGHRRTAAQRRARRPGIDYDGVPESLREAAVEPGDREYGAVRSTYLRGGAPGLVLRARTPEQVADALAFARRHRHLPLGVRSGGHGISGRSTNDGGLVLDIGAMDDIEVLDRDQRLVRIGPGATWKQVAAALDPYGWALGSGDYGGVGVGGLATGGGVGLMSRHHGLTIDHLRAVELVLADGSRVRATEEENTDLFWAVRGAGANVGVATAFEFQVDEVAEVGWAKLVLVSSDLEDALSLFGELAGDAPRDTTVFLVTGRPRQGQSVLQLFAVVDSPDPDVVVERLSPFTRLGSLVQQRVVLTRYAGVMAEAHDVGPDGQQGQGEPVSRSALLPALTAEFAHDAAELLRSGRVFFFQLRTMGGAIADVPAEATAFAHRSSAFQMTAMGADQSALDAAVDPLAGHFRGRYLSFDTDLRPGRIDDTFPPATLARLREVKRRYDPGNLFRDNYNIPPDADDGAVAHVTTLEEIS